MNYYTPGSTNKAGWNGWTQKRVDAFPIENWDFPASYVSLLENNTARISWPGAHSKRLWLEKKLRT